MTDFLLVHAPLLGPGSWRPVANELTAAGHRVAVPDLRDATERADGWWDRAAQLCADAGRELSDVVVVGHLGAGVVLALVAARCGASAAVFVDAITPAATGYTASREGICPGPTWTR